MSAEFETFESALKRVSNSVELVTTDLQDSCKYIRSRFIEAGRGGGWPQFLQEDGGPSSTGTACITTSLVRMGVSRRDPQIIAAGEFLRADQREDGGWSKPEFSDHLSLTLISCLSLHALAAAGTTSGDLVADRGLKWIENAQNTDGGWGQIARDERSDVTATAYALRALTADESAAEMFKETLERGSDWIMHQQNSDGGWGIRKDEPSSLAHTAHAAEGLLVCGYRREPDGLLADAHNWLLSKLPGSSLMPWVEHYRPPPAIAENLPRSMRSARLSWSHLPAERSLIALLKLGIDPDNEVITALVADLAARHEQGKCWRVQTMPQAVASWAVLEAVNALCPYVAALERIRYEAALRGVIGQLIPRLTTLETQQRELKLQLEALSGQVATQLRPRHGWMRKLGRFAAAPATHAGVVIAVTATFLVLYIRVWSHGQGAGTLLLGIATIVGAALALLELIRRKRSL